MEFTVKEKKKICYFYVDNMKVAEVPASVLANVLSFGGDLEHYVEVGIIEQCYSNCCVKDLSKITNKLVYKR